MSSAAPPTNSTLYLPWDVSRSTSLGHQTRLVHRREHSSVSNYLHSIAYDAKFVQLIRSYYPQYAALGNRRNGPWYAQSWDGLAYFKSTDGHQGQWRFSSTRLNLNVITSACKHNGVLIVDSTRAGKNYPDALTATVPLWCAVINAVCLEVEGASSKWLFTPPWVSASEHAQMAARVQETVSCMASTQRALIRQHGKALRGPLVPLWVRPGPGSDSPLVTTAARGGERGEPPPAALLPSGSVCRDGVPPLLEGDLGYVPVLCVSASRSISDDRHRQQHSWQYIQGAGDDEEHWARGLTAPLFWAHARALLAASADDCEVAVDKLVAKGVPVVGRPLCQVGHTGIWVGQAAALQRYGTTASAVPPLHTVIDLSSAGSASASANADAGVGGGTAAGGGAGGGAGAAVVSLPYHLIRLPVQPGKRSNSDSWWYSHVLPRAIGAALVWLARDAKAANCAIVCDDGCTASVAAATAVLVALYGDGLEPLPSVRTLLASWGAPIALGSSDGDETALPHAALSKAFIRNRYAALQAHVPAATVPRRLMIQLNKFFLPSAAAAAAAGDTTHCKSIFEAFWEALQS